MSHDPNAAGLAINWHIFGSNGQETADYSKGVLERFMRRAPKNCNINRLVKTIDNPRVMDTHEVHTSNYFAGFYSVNENGKRIRSHLNDPVTDDKIVINHYHTKSREEYEIKIKRGTAVTTTKRTMAEFRHHDRNEAFDDGILKYRDERAKVYQSPDKSHADEKLLSALERNLSPTLSEDTPQDFYAGKMETFLTCRTAGSWLKRKLTDDSQAKFFEEAALKAIVKSLASELTFREKILFVRELPELLNLSYPAVNDLRIAGLRVVSTLKKNFGSKIAELSFRAITKTLSGDLTQAEKLSFIKELSEILEVNSLAVKDMRIAELQFTQKFTNDFASKRMWREHLVVWKDYFEMNYIHDLLNLE